MGKTVRLIVIGLCLAAGLLIGSSGAFAGTLACGDCHSVPPVDANNCTDTARGLHGTHTNYSSTLLQPGDNRCGYCHTTVAGTAPTATHINFYINVTTTAEAPSLSWDGTGDTCTGACHNNNGSTAAWGNFTSPAVALSCAACHDDSAEAQAGTSALSGAHETHLQTAISVSGLGADDNSDCDACHPDNTGDWFSGGMADDGSVKAYPHASDGTNVDPDNASLDAGLSATRSNGDNADTCAGACHTNLTDDQWGAASLQCASCHNTTATSAANTAATVSLTGSHNKHFDAGKTCTNCHPNNTDTVHVAALPVTFWNGSTANTNVTVNALLNWNGSTCTNTGIGCHGTGETPDWSGAVCNGCRTCHNYPDGSNWTGDNGHTVQYDTSVTANSHLGLPSDYNYCGDTYAGVTGDSSKCGKCHSGGTHNDGTIDVAGSGNGACGTDFTINVNTTGSDVDCSDVKCHSGSTTPNWW